MYLPWVHIQKGYRPYDLVARWSFTSADVTFFESTSYFSKESSFPNVSSNALPLLVSTSLPHGSITDSSTQPLQVYSRHRPLSSTLLDVATDLPSLLAAPAPPLRIVIFPLLFVKVKGLVLLIPRLTIFLLPVLVLCYVFLFPFLLHLFSGHVISASP